MRKISKTKIRKVNRGPGCGSSGVEYLICMRPWNQSLAPDGPLPSAEEGEHNIHQMYSHNKTLNKEGKPQQRRKHTVN